MEQLNIRRLILRGVPVLLEVLCGAFVLFWILEMGFHTNFTDHAAPLLAGCLFFATPVAVIITWLAGRKGSFRPDDKLIAWSGIMTVLLPWAFVCFAFLSIAGWNME